MDRYSIKDGCKMKQYIVKNEEYKLYSKKYISEEKYWNNYNSKNYISEDSDDVEVGHRNLTTGFTGITRSVRQYTFKETKPIPVAQVVSVASFEFPSSAVVEVLDAATGVF